MLSVLSSSCAGGVVRVAAGVTDRALLHPSLRPGRGRHAFAAAVDLGLPAPVSQLMWKCAVGTKEGRVSCTKDKKNYCKACGKIVARKV